MINNSNTSITMKTLASDKGLALKTLEMQHKMLQEGHGVSHNINDMALRRTLRENAVYKPEALQSKIINHIDSMSGIEQAELVNSMFHGDYSAHKDAVKSVKESVLQQNKKFAKYGADFIEQEIVALSKPYYEGLEKMHSSQNNEGVIHNANADPFVTTDIGTGKVSLDRRVAKIVTIEAKQRPIFDYSIITGEENSVESLMGDNIIDATIIPGNAPLNNMTAMIPGQPGFGDVVQIALKNRGKISFAVAGNSTRNAIDPLQYQTDNIQYGAQDFTTQTVQFTESLCFGMSQQIDNANNFIRQAFNASPIHLALDNKPLEEEIAQKERMIEEGMKASAYLAVATGRIDEDSKQFSCVLRKKVKTSSNTEALMSTSQSVVIGGATVAIPNVNVTTTKYWLTIPQAYEDLRAVIRMLYKPSIDIIKNAPMDSVGVNDKFALSVPHVSALASLPALPMTDDVTQERGIKQLLNTLIMQNALKANNIDSEQEKEALELYSKYMATVGTDTMTRLQQVQMLLAMEAINASNSVGGGSGGGISTTVPMLEIVDTWALACKEDLANNQRFAYGDKVFNPYQNKDVCVVYNSGSNRNKHNTMWEGFNSNTIGSDLLATPAYYNGNYAGLQINGGTQMTYLSRHSIFFEPKPVTGKCSDFAFSTSFPWV